MPLVAVTVIVKLPVVAEKPVETINVDVAVPPADSVTLVGLKLSVVFAGTGETVAVRVRVPVKPLRLIVVIVDELLLPAATVILPGLAAIVKSGGVIAVTITVTVVEWDGTPVPVPVTVIV